MPLSGMQQICETVPPEEENKGNLDGIQQTLDREVEALVGNYAHFVALPPHRIKQKFAAFLLNCEQHILFSLHKLCRRGNSVFCSCL